VIPASWTSTGQASTARSLRAGSRHLCAPHRGRRGVVLLTVDSHFRTPGAYLRPTNAIAVLGRSGLSGGRGDSPSVGNVRADPAPPSTAASADRACLGQNGGVKPEEPTAVVPHGGVPRSALLRSALFASKRPMTGLQNPRSGVVYIRREVESASTLDIETASRSWENRPSPTRYFSLLIRPSPSEAGRANDDRFGLRKTRILF
jgi:hypothetical protein